MARNALTPFGVAYGGWDPFMSLHREMNRLFDDVYRGGASSREGAGVQGAGELINARMNVSETDKEIRLSAELPGVDPQDVEITLDDNTLTIRGEKKFEQERGEAKENFHFVERAYGSFQRSLRLPFAVNPDEVRADFRNGVLTVIVPKNAQQQRSRRIQIGRGDQAAQAVDVGQERRDDPSGSEPDQRPSTGGDEQPLAH
jgi:HSP20 family protein